MAGWGALIGLGQGLQDTAQIWNEHQKGKLSDKLAKEREQRQADRDLAKEQRQEAARLRQVDTSASNLITDPTTGGYQRQLRNSNFDLLDTVAVSDLEAESINRQREADKAKIEAQGLEAQLKQLQVERMPQKWAQEDAMHSQRLRSESALQAQRYASAAASNRRGLEGSMSQTGPRNSATDAQTLLSSYETLVNDYTRSTKDTPAKLSRSEVEEAAVASVRRSAQQGDRPEQVAARFRETLRIMAERKNSTPSGTPRRSGTLLGN